MREDQTTVAINKETQIRLLRRKLNGKESMDSVVKRLLDKDTSGHDGTEDRKTYDNRFLLVKIKKTINGLDSDVSKLIISLEKLGTDTSRILKNINELKIELESKGDFK